MESIRWLFAAAGVEFEEQFIENRKQLLKLISDGDLLFEQVPMVEIDGMKLVQTTAILRYVAEKYNLYGKNLKEKLQIDMYVLGARDLMDLLISHPFLPPEQKEKNLETVNTRATTRYLPVYEKALKTHGGDYLVGDCLSWADVQVLEMILAVEEKFSSILSRFPKLQEFKTKISSVPTIKKFLQPGSQKKPPSDDAYVKLVREVFAF